MSSPITKVCPILDQLWSSIFPCLILSTHWCCLWYRPFTKLFLHVFANWRINNVQIRHPSFIMAKKCILAMKSISWRSWHLQNHQTPLHIHLPPRHQRLPRFLSIFSAREEVPKLRICELVDGRVGPNLGRGAQDWIKPQAAKFFECNIQYMYMFLYI